MQKLFLRILYIANFLGEIVLAKVRAALIIGIVLVLVLCAFYINGQSVKKEEAFKGARLVYGYAQTTGEKLYGNK